MKKQKALKPFFKYYGSKWSLCKYYNEPLTDKVIEPFAGSACYSLHHWQKQIYLNDLDDQIAALWAYLIKVKEKEIMGLPYLKTGQSVDDLKICNEAKTLIGYWIGFACSTPRKTESKTSATQQLKHPNQCLSWAEPAKKRIVAQLPKIRHWKVANLCYSDLNDARGTWFIDPPYFEKGYKYKKSEIDYPKLAAWAEQRTSHYIVCEADGACWMDFQPFKTMTNSSQQHRKEVVIQRGWENCNHNRI